MKWSRLRIKYKNEYTLCVNFLNKKYFYLNKTFFVIISLTFLNKGHLNKNIFIAGQREHCSRDLNFYAWIQPWWLGSLERRYSLSVEYGSSERWIESRLGTIIW